MKIIEPPKIIWTQQVKCKGCSAKLEIELDDVQYEVTDEAARAQQYKEDIEGEYFVICIACEGRIKIKNIPPAFTNEIKNR